MNEPTRNEESLVTSARTTFGALLILIPLLIALLVLQPGPAIFFAVLVLLVLVPVLFLDDLRGLLLILIFRPMLDVVGEQVLFSLRGVAFNLSSLVSILVIVWAFSRILARQIPIARRPLFWPITLFLLVTTASLATTFSLGMTVREVVRVFGIFLLYFVAQELIPTPQQLRRLAGALAWSLVVPVAVALYQLATKTGLDFGGVSNRLLGTFGHPNVFAFYLVVALGLFLSAPGVFASRRRKLMLVGIAVLGFCLLFTYTRGAWLGFGIFLLLLGLVRLPKLVLSGAVIVIALLAAYPFIQRITLSAINLDLNRVPLIARVLDRNTEQSSLDWRNKLWSEMRRKVTEAPLTGHGLGTFPILRQQQVKGYFEGTEAHNDYLRLAVETGFPGLAAYLIVLLAPLVYAVRRAWQLRRTEHRTFAIGIAGLVIAVSVMSYYDNLLQATAVMWAYWTVLGASFAVLAKNRE